MQRQWSFALGSTLLGGGLNVLLAVVKHPPAFLYFVGWAAVSVGLIILAILACKEMSKRRKTKQRYGDPRKQRRAPSTSTGSNDHRPNEAGNSLRIGRNAFAVNGGPGQVMSGVESGGIQSTVRPDGTEETHIGHFTLGYLGPRGGNQPTGRVGYRGRQGSYGDLSKATFGEKLDTAIDNEGDVDASEADFK